MQIAFVLDIIIAVLLVLTITYAVRLNQRLSQLRGDKKELQALAKTFADATDKAESSIRKLKVSTEALQAEVDKAETLKDDLAYLVERGERTADQMMEASRAPKTPNKPSYGENDGDGQLIQDAIRAASADQGRPAQGRAQQTVASNAVAQSAPRPAPRPAPANGFSDEDLAPPPGASDAQAPTPARSQRGQETTRKLQSLGGGLGGVRAEDRLLGNASTSNDAPQSVGETDAARELLKALSSVK